MPIPVTYRNSGDGSIASYNYLDIMTGTAYKTFYGLQSTSGATTSYILSPNSLASTITHTNSGANTAMNLTFDLPVEILTRIGGQAQLYIPTGVYRTGTAGDLTTTVSGQLFVVSSAGVETDIGSSYEAQSWIGIGGSTSYWKGNTYKINVPKMNVQPGERIRLKIFTTAAGANCVVEVLHDPENMEVSTYLLDYKLRLNLPLQIFQ